MTREIEIEIFDQSNVISFNILKDKKRDVDKLINDLSAIFSNYIFIRISHRNLMSDESLRRKSQISFLLFQLFFSSFLFQIIGVFRPGFFFHQVFLLCNFHTFQLFT